MGTNDFDQAFWWYQEGDETLGPSSEAELRRLAATGKLQAQSLVWREDYGEDWRTLEESGILAATASNSYLEVSDHTSSGLRRHPSPRPRSSGLL